MQSMMVMGGPFSMGSPFMESPSIETSVKSIVGKLDGYRVIQDQSRPEYAAIFKDGIAVGELTSNVAEPIHRVSFRSPFENGYSLVFQTAVQSPRQTQALTSSMSSSQPIPLNVYVGLEDEADAYAIYHDLVASGKTPLLRAEVLIGEASQLRDKLEAKHVDLLHVDSLYDSDEFEDIDGLFAVIVCKETDEFIGYLVSAEDEHDPKAAFMRIVTPRRELIEAILTE